MKKYFIIFTFLMISFTNSYAVKIEHRKGYIEQSILDKCRNHQWWRNLFKDPPKKIVKKSLKPYLNTDLKDSVNLINIIDIAIRHRISNYPTSKLRKKDINAVVKEIISKATAT